MIRYYEEVRTQTISNFFKIALPVFLPVYFLMNAYDWLVAPAHAPQLLTLRSAMLPIFGIFYAAFKKNWRGPWHLGMVWFICFTVSLQHILMAYEMQMVRYIIGLNLMGGALLVIFPLPPAQNIISMVALYIPMALYFIAPGQPRAPLFPTMIHCTTMMVIFIATSTALDQLRCRAFRQRTDLFQLATTDPLSGLKMRRYFFNRFIQELSLQLRKLEGPYITVAIIDIDGFKAVNDKFGHSVGDQCIRHIGELIQRSTRIYDVACRFGGEEFTIFFPSTQFSEAAMVCERIRKVIEHAPLTVRGKRVPLSVSIGLSGITPPIPSKIRGQYFSAHREQKSFLVKCMMRIIKEADRSLYEAKKRGKNQVALGNPADLESEITEEERGLVKQYLVYFDQQALLMNEAGEEPRKKGVDDTTFYPPEFFFRRCVEGLYRSYRDPDWNETLTLVRIAGADERKVKRALVPMFRLADVFSIVEPGLMGILFVGLPLPILEQVRERIKLKVRSLPGLDDAEVKVAATVLHFDTDAFNHHRRKMPVHEDFCKAVDKLYYHLRDYNFHKGERLYIYVPPRKRIRSA